jgi:hypothetical protein
MRHIGGVQVVTPEAVIAALEQAGHTLLNLRLPSTNEAG